MRIVHVVRSDAFAGVERYVCGVANELTARGHEVATVGGAPLRMRDELHESIDHTPAASSLDVVRALARLGKVDVVHAHMTAAEVASIGARIATRAPVVSTRHFPRPRLRRMPMLGRLIGARMATQVAISEFVARGIGEPSIVIHSGVQPQPQSQFREPIVLLLQRLEREKAPLDAIAAWAKSGLGQEGWKLLVAGSGSLEPAARDLAQTLGVGGSVFFLGHVSATNDLLAQAAVLLAPGSVESFGLSVVEAMARGIPVTAARGGAHVETLGDDGRYFEPGDTDGAAAQLAELGRDPELRLRLGCRLRARQEAMFSIAQHVTRLEHVYASVTGGG